MPVPLFSRTGSSITTHDDWGTLAKPASETHWKRGRSAWELADAWTNGTGAADLTVLLGQGVSVGAFVVDRAVAEAQTRFDQFGGPRNHDLLVVGHDDQGPIVIGVEGKADEPYGETVAAYRDSAQRKVDARTPTNAPARLEGLLADLAGTTLQDRPGLGELRYQLLSAIAGTLTEAAAHDARAVLVVHEFVTTETAAPKREANHGALRLAVNELFAVATPAGPSWLVGPVHVPAARWANVGLWIGRLTTVSPDATAAN